MKGMILVWFFYLVTPNYQFPMHKLGPFATQAQCEQQRKVFTQEDYAATPCYEISVKGE